MNYFTFCGEQPSLARHDTWLLLVFVLWLTAGIPPSCAVDPDGEGLIEFAAPFFAVKETSSAATITVKRKNSTIGTVEVNYSTSDGTATAGEDYDARSGTLIFPPGVRTKTFSVPIHRDMIADGGETVALALSAPSGHATLGQQSTAALAIVEKPLAVVRKRSAPGSVLTLHGAFDPAQTQVAIFRGAAGNEISADVFDVRRSSLKVLVPPGLDPASLQPTGALASIRVQQGSDVFGPIVNFQIAALLASDEAAGSVTLKFLDLSAHLCDRAIERWLAIENQSEGSVDTSVLRDSLASLKQQLTDFRAELQSVADGNPLSVPLGQLAGQNLQIDSTALAMTDRLILAYLSEGKGVDQVMRRLDPEHARADSGSSVLQDKLEPGRLPTTAAVFKNLSDFKTWAGAGLNVAIGGAEFFEVLTLTEAVTFAAVAGPALIFAAVILPAGVALAADAFADPFIHIILGRAPDRSLYEPEIDALGKGFTDLLSDKLQGALLDGALPAFGADETLLNHMKIGLIPAVSMLLDNPFFGPGSDTEHSFNNIQTLVAHRPLPKLSVNDTTVLAPLGGTIATKFLVVVSGPGDLPIDFQFETFPATAGAEDYVDKSGTMRIPAGRLKAYIPVTIKTDSFGEPDEESFNINLLNPHNARIDQGNAFCTIRHRKKGPFEGPLTGSVPFTRFFSDHTCTWSFSYNATIRMAPILHADNTYAGNATVDGALTFSSGSSDCNSGSFPIHQTRTISGTASALRWKIPFFNRDDGAAGYVGDFTGALNGDTITGTMTFEWTASDGVASGVLPISLPKQ